MNKRNNKWVAYITDNGKRISLGHHKKFNDAVCARLDAEQRLGFSTM